MCADDFARNVIPTVWDKWTNTIIGNNIWRLFKTLDYEAVTVALISGLCVAVPSVITTMFSNNKANTLMNYRIDELTKKVEKHNNVVERMALQERETKAIWKRIDEIKEELEKESE